MSHLNIAFDLLVHDWIILSIADFVVIIVCSSGRVRRFDSIGGFRRLEAYDGTQSKIAAVFFLLK